MFATTNRRPGYEHWLYRSLAASTVLALVLLITFTVVRGRTPELPWVKVLGAGFMFNYRVADSYAGFSAIPMRSIPVGSILRAEFENPDGGAPLIVTEQVGLADRTLTLRSPSLHGVRADVDYALNISLLDRSTGNVFWSHNLTLRSAVDQSIMPDNPLTVGPGYQRYAPVPEREGRP